MGIKTEFKQLKQYGELKKLMRKLKSEPSKDVIGESDVTWGNSWFVQQDLNLVFMIRNLIAEMCIELFKDDDLKLQKDSRGNYIWTYAMGRLLDDSSTSNYYRKQLKYCYFKMDCISTITGRMYEQPYFALHEDEATINLTDGVPVKSKVISDVRDATQRIIQLELDIKNSEKYIKSCCQEIETIKKYVKDLNSNHKEEIEKDMNNKLSEGNLLKENHNF